MKLDKTKTYQMIYGSPTMRYEQDGHVFGWDEKPLETEAVVIHHTDKPKSRSEIMKEAWARRKSA